MAESKKRKKLSDEISDEIGDFEGCIGRMRSTELQLNNFIASSSLKLNNTNQDKIRKLNADIMEQALIQNNNAIHCLLGRLVESREMAATRTDKREDVFSYAEITKKPPTKSSITSRSSSRKRGDTAVALVYPTDGSDSEMTKNIIKHSINPVHLELGIRKLKKISKGGILMEMDNEILISWRWR